MKPEELLSEARRVLWAGLIDNGDELVSAAPQIFIDAGMLVPSGGAAELVRLRARVAELEAERHSTNDALAETTIALRAAEDVRPQVAQVRALIARQAGAVEDPHDSPLHHEYRTLRNLPEVTP
ncbi:hypothetical protein J7I98_04230 [Streptomyces sp. ISL-98]|uniref:hypothetical protein n=1 Tax=Streptomyces sp. ISL-98 TaxID=2819192 RepID=UPI001BE95052|nr:hypothetical protein [Streptomyces sp. ISL-98]MBT2505115.1 hypothetical protein [Streptomyces sp. ISL-98]